MKKKIRQRLDKTVKVERCTKKLNPNAEAFKSKESHSGEIYGLLKGMIEQQAAPDVEMETFDGNPLEYHHFMDLFREVVEKWIFSFSVFTYIFCIFSPLHTQVVTHGITHLYFIYCHMILPICV